MFQVIHILVSVPSTEEKEPVARTFACTLNCLGHINAFLLSSEECLR